MTRREWVAFSAASAWGQTVTDDRVTGIIRGGEEAVERGLAMQIIDLKDDSRGGYRNADGLPWGSSGAALLNTFIPAYVHSKSRFYKSRELGSRIQLALDHVRRSQNEHGNFYLPITNYNSPPDTAFIMLGMAPLVGFARKAEFQELEADLKPIVLKAGHALAAGGVHTPNHRWVASAALSKIHRQYPNQEYLRRIDQWLAEGIDIDADGQYTERSTYQYSPIVDNALVTIAHYLDRPRLLDPVRRNLNSLMYLVHADGELVTEISRRQDLNQRGDLGPYFFPLRYLALKDRNAQYAFMANRFEDRIGLHLWMEFPEILARGPAPVAPPENYEKLFPVTGLARIRRGQTSASILGEGRDRFLTLRRGASVVNAVRFASAFFGKGQFRAEKMEKLEPGKYRLTQRLQAGYYQPFDPPRVVTTETYDNTREQRRQTEVCTLTQIAEIAEIPNGFRLRVSVTGTEHVPVTIEVNLRPGGTIRGAEPRESAPEAWMAGKEVEYRTAGPLLRITGPGASHRYIDVRGALPRLSGPSVYFTGIAPFDEVLTFTWAS